MMIAAFTAAFFILIFWVLRDGRDDADISLFSAGIGAGIVLLMGIVVREIILRDAQQKYHVARRLIDRNIRTSQQPVNGIGFGEGKLTLERNAAILREIGKKSSAAKVLGKFAEGHREVFELCENYMAAVETELPNVGPGSPRLAALRKGSKVAGEYHHFHLLQFTEIEAKTLAQKANAHANIFDRLNTAQQALSVVDFALQHYPHESGLRDSHKILSELVISIKVSGFVEQAEEATRSGEHMRAVGLYNDALEELRGTGFASSELQSATAKIEEAIERLKLMFNK